MIGPGFSWRYLNRYLPQSCIRRRFGIVANVVRHRRGDRRVTHHLPQHCRHDLVPPTAGRMPAAGRERWRTCGLSRPPSPAHRPQRRLSRRSPTPSCPRFLGGVESLPSLDSSLNTRPRRRPRDARSSAANSGVIGSTSSRFAFCASAGSAAWADGQLRSTTIAPGHVPPQRQRFGEPQPGLPQAAQVELPRCCRRVLDHCRDRRNHPLEFFPGDRSASHDLCPLTRFGMLNVGSASQQPFAVSPSHRRLEMAQVPGDRRFGLAASVVPSRMPSPAADVTSASFAGRQHLLECVERRFIGRGSLAASPAARYSCSLSERLPRHARRLGVTPLT